MLFNLWHANTHTLPPPPFLARSLARCANIEIAIPRILTHLPYNTARSQTSARVHDVHKSFEVSVIGAVLQRNVRLKHGNFACESLAKQCEAKMLLNRWYK